MSTAVRTDGLEKRFGNRVALEQCTISIPVGAVTALVGPNGAGKTTLLRLLAGLRRPTAGTVEVLGRQPGDDQEFLSSIGFLGQEAPLYHRLSADEHLRVLARVNTRYDVGSSRTRLQRLRIPLDQPAGTLSGGQRAQVALALALAKQPELLLLDEPVAALDPLARHEFLATLAEAVAEGDLTVILSSHLVHDLERVCDHVVLVARARTQLCGAIDDILSSHRLVVGPRSTGRELARFGHVVHVTHADRLSRALVAHARDIPDPLFRCETVGLEEVVLGYMGGEEDVIAGPLSLSKGIA